MPDVIDFDDIEYIGRPSDRFAKAKQLDADMKRMRDWLGGLPKTANPQSVPFSRAVLECLLRYIELLKEERR